MALNKEQAKAAAEVLWRTRRPHRLCEICGAEHRCHRIWVEDESGVEAAIEEMVKLFVKSLRAQVTVGRREDRISIQKQKEVGGP